jgi:anti-sigma regulatory factor (Ser/Thr protein kinase)
MYFGFRGEHFLFTKRFGVMMKNFTIKYVLTVIEDIKKTVQGVVGYVEQGNELSAERRFGIELVLNELLVNCFKHTNPSASEPVVLVAGIYDGKLSVNVTDNGKGFEYATNLEPTDPVMIMEEYGRGLTLVRAFCDSIKYNLNGNSVEVEIAL